MNIIKKIVALLLTLISTMVTYAGNVSGRVVDSSKEPMIQASIRLLAAKDSAYVTGTATNDNGRFRLQGVKSGKYILQGGISPQAVRR